jgi:hypothetical protein
LRRAKCWPLQELFGTPTGVAGEVRLFCPGGCIKMNSYVRPSAVKLSTMNQLEKFKSLAWTIDVVVFPIVGLMFVCGGLWMALLGRAQVNNQELSYAKQPVQFVAVVAGAVAIGLMCIGFATVRMRLSRRQ